MDPEPKPPEPSPASEPSESPETTPTVEAVFGKEPPAAPSEPSPKSSEPSASPPSPSPPPSASEPPDREPSKRENKRMQHLTAELKQKDAVISGLEAELSKYRDREQLTPEEAVDKRFAENELKREQASLERGQAEYAALAEAELSEAFPDEASREDFAVLSSEYAPAIDRYAPRVSELVLGSEIKHRLANALYTVLSGNPSALRDFLNMPYPAQRREIKGLESFLLRGAPSAPSSAPASAPSSSPPPRSIVPSESGAASSEPDPYEAVLAREAERNRKIYG